MASRNWIKNGFVANDFADFGEIWIEKWLTGSAGCCVDLICSNTNEWRGQPFSLRNNFSQLIWAIRPRCSHLTGRAAHWFIVREIFRFTASHRLTGVRMEKKEWRIGRRPLQSHDAAFESNGFEFSTGFDFLERMMKWDGDDESVWRFSLISHVITLH